MPKLIPFGERILVRRKQIGEKVGSIVLPQEVSERATDLAEVVYIPEDSFADKELVSNSDNIINALISKSSSGDSDALISLLRLNEFYKMKSVKVGDTVLISKYVGTDFHKTGEQDYLTIVNLSDIMGLVVKDE